MNRSVHAWTLEGTVFVACNCDYGCPCNFNALPTLGYCEGGWTWAVEAGSFGDVDLSGLPFALFVKWPGAIHEGNGEGVLIVDERATEDQRAAVKTLVDGGVGGPWGILGWTWPTLHGPLPAPFEVSRDGVEWVIRAGEYLEVESEPIRNPVSGAEVHPSATLPEGLIFKQGDFGSSRTLRVLAPISIDYSRKYTAVGRFAYQGP
jgi:hypothetical protein